MNGKVTGLIQLGQQVIAQFLPKCSPANAADSQNKPWPKDNHPKIFDATTEIATSNP
jgi:hypothetical protein